MTYQFAEVPAAKGAPLLFLLHGTGGDEHDLIGLGRQVMAGAHLVAPRGDVLEGGAPRFFRRLGMGVYDMDDLTRATGKLADFIRDTVARVQPGSVAALGYSNGANILASVLFTAPDLIDRAVLMHPLIPFEPPAHRGLGGRQVLITAGRHDPITPEPATQGLADYFAAQGARADLVWHDGGHELRPSEVAAARAFLSGREFDRPVNA
jgi:phospholipase/carboxylesterase